MKTNKKITALLLLVFALTFVFTFTTFKSNNVKAFTEDEQAEILSYFSKIGDAEGENGADALVDYVKSITYEDFEATNFSGSGVMVSVRNKTPELVDHEENSNDTNPMLLDFFATKYPVGVKLNKDVYIADNTSNDTLLELSFPGANDNYQACGIKILIEDATDPNKHIALYVWRAYGNTDAGDAGSIIASAGGTWEKTRLDNNFVYIGETGFDYMPGTADGRFVKVGNDINDGADSDVKPKDGCYLNTKEYGHEKTSVKLGRTSANTIKVQFDYETAVLSINGVEIRHFKDYSADGEHYFPGFTDGKVRLSVGYVRSTRRSTDEFTRFCIMNVDKHNSVLPPFSGLIASGNANLPKPINYSLFEGEQPISDEFTANITDPNGNKTEGYSAATYNFNVPGEYTIEYFQGEELLGTAKFATAYKDAQGNLSEIVSFETSENMFCGKTISLADFKLKLEDFVAIESATVEIYSGETLVATEAADAEWEYVLQNKGELTFVVSNDSFALKTTATVLPGIYPAAATTNGTVVVDEIGEATGLYVGTHTLVLTPAEGYRLASLLVNGEDVTSDVEDGEYEIEVETLDDNITYVATFEAIPTYAVTFKAGTETLSTETVREGTLFKDVAAPEITAKAGYQAAGWNIELDQAITADVTAEAQYTVITYTITYNLDGGTNSADNVATYTIEDAITLKAPTKEGYTFLGWKNSNNETVTAIAKGTTGDITLTANWEANTPDEPEQPDQPDQPTQPDEPTKKGCKGLVGTLPILALLIPAAVVIKRRKDLE